MDCVPKPSMLIDALTVDVSASKGAREADRRPSSFAAGMEGNGRWKRRMRSGQTAHPSSSIFGVEGEEAKMVQQSAVL